MVFYGSAVAIVVFSAIPSFAGVDKGICRLSEFDMLLALPAPEADPPSA